MSVHVERFVGQGIEPYLPDLAALRIAVFREWPYLYDGSAEYESRYLRGYLTDGAMIAIAFDEARVVGASTALPLRTQIDIALPGLGSLGIDHEAVYYFGESVLQPEYRGQGLGHRFFDERERYARELGFAWAAFCAVERPANHPRRPTDYVPHDAFWGKRGFTQHPELVSHFSWKDLGDERESQKPMIFWLKRFEHFDDSRAD